jgi:hypothetical protein
MGLDNASQKKGAPAFRNVSMRFLAPDEPRAPTGWRSFPMCISHHRLSKLISSWSSGSAFCIARGGATGAIARPRQMPMASPIRRLNVAKIAKIAKPTGSKLLKSLADSGKICSVEVEEK